MIFKQHLWAVAALCIGLGVGSCTSFSGAVSDHWPHWAGGEPGGLPPRPGAPGYEDYVAHRQAAVAQPPQAATGSAAPVAPPSAPPVQSSSPATAGVDTANSQGGLY